MGRRTAGWSIDFSRAKRGPVVKPEPGKTKISIRLENTVLEYFRDLVGKPGGGNYQTLINDALLEHIHRRDPGRRAASGSGRTLTLPSRAGFGDSRARTPAAERRTKLGLMTKGTHRVTLSR